jgi:hypothetical protein
MIREAAWFSETLGSNTSLHGVTTCKTTACKAKLFQWLIKHHAMKMYGRLKVRGPFAKFVDWRQCAAVMQREAVTYAKF